MLNNSNFRRSGYFVQSPPLKGVGQVDKLYTCCPDSPFGQFVQVDKRKQLLDSYKSKQDFRCAKGKSKWIQYKTFDKDFNMREILDDEVVLEFDMPEDYSGGIKVFQNKVGWPGINFTAIKLLDAGIAFEIWDHGGKSPHLHVHNLPIAGLSAEKRSLFKKLFIKKYVPAEYSQYCDTSLCGIHLIALEWAEHWKGCYEVKKLIHKWEAKK